MTDATQPLRDKASQYDGVAEGTACTQSSFKRGKKSFFFIGQQGGRHKAMFKLKDSKAEAAKLAKTHPETFQVGTNIWITARFSDDAPLKRELWEKWMDESYELSG